MARRAEITQEKIDLAALALFAEKGVDRTTINDIASAAGIAEGTIYRRCASKDELIWGLFSSNYADLPERLERLQARLEDGTDFLVVPALHTFIASDPEAISATLAFVETGISANGPDFINAGARPFCNHRATGALRPG